MLKNYTLSWISLSDNVVTNEGPFRFFLAKNRWKVWDELSLYQLVGLVNTFKAKVERRNFQSKRQDFIIFFTQLFQINLIDYRS